MNATSETARPRRLQAVGLDDLILRRAYKEAKSLINFDAARPPKAENDKR